MQSSESSDDNLHLLASYPTPSKPIIDMLLVVIDSTDEDSYVRDLAAPGYVLRIRETNWFEHRMFNGPDSEINLHVFSSGCREIDRLLIARREWKYVQNTPMPRPSSSRRSSHEPGVD